MIVNYKRWISLDYKFLIPLLFFILIIFLDYYVHFNRKKNIYNDEIKSVIFLIKAHNRGETEYFYKMDKYFIQKDFQINEMTEIQTGDSIYKKPESDYLDVYKKRNNQYILSKRYKLIFSVYFI